MTNTISGLVFILIGLLTMIGAALNWGIIMRPGRLFNRLAGETVARPVYIAAGLVLIVLGILRFAGINLFGR